MEIIIKGTQGEGKTVTAKAIAEILARWGDRNIQVVFGSGSSNLEEEVMKNTGRLAFQKKTVGVLIIDAIAKGELKAAKKAVKVAQKRGRDFTPIYVVQG